MTNDEHLTLTNLGLLYFVVFGGRWIATNIPQEAKGREREVGATIYSTVLIGTFGIKKWWC